MSDTKKTEKTEWKITANRFVAFLDILGFKEMVMREDHDKVYEKMKLLVSAQGVLCESFERIARKSNIDTDFKIVNFSDSIIIFSRGNSENDFKYLVLAVSCIIGSAIDQGIPIKGGLAYGEVSVDGDTNIYLGKPIIDAYLLEEDVKYFGVVAHNSIDTFLNTCHIKEEDINKLFFKAKTYLKSGHTTHSNVNWFHSFERLTMLSGKSVKEAVEQFRLTTTGSPRMYIDNTLEMLEMCDLGKDGSV